VIDTAATAAPKRLSLAASERYIVRISNELYNSTHDPVKRNLEKLTGFGAWAGCPEWKVKDGQRRNLFVCSEIGLAGFLGMLGRELLIQI
jgi:hypothetical protein